MSNVMTAEEKQKMMEEIMQVVDKHVANSKETTKPSKEQLRESNKYGREFGISDEKMAAWKEEYRRMRVDTKAILEEVRKNPIDTSRLDASFDIDAEINLGDIHHLILKH